MPRFNRAALRELVSEIHAEILDDLGDWDAQVDAVEIADAALNDDWTWNGAFASTGATYEQALEEAAKLPGVYVSRRNPSPGNALRAADGWAVVAIPHSTAKALVESLHYSRSASNTSVLAAGLVAPDGRIAGAALWMPPSAGAAKWLHNGTGANYHRLINLSRLAVHPSVPTNGATFLMQGSLKILRQAGYQVAITYADALQGHTGAIYRAANWLPAGSTQARTRWTDASGRMRSTRAGNVWENGFRYNRNLTVAEMKAKGWTPKRSPGKARFVIAVNRRYRKAVARFAASQA